MRIMIVEDNAAMREMIRDTVYRDNDSVLECSDGAEAIKKYPEFVPDVVLMDIEMKGMDGFTASEYILQQFPEARFIFVTSHNTSAFRIKAKNLRAVGFITKENLSELTQILHH